jgi:hypothetical protein
MNVQNRVGSLKKSLKDTDDDLESHAANCKLALALVSTPKSQRLYGMFCLWRLMIQFDMIRLANFAFFFIRCDQLFVGGRTQAHGP